MYLVHFLLALVHLCPFCISFNSHWIVTQDGKINKQDGSPFDLHQSHNLFSLLDQEKRIAQLHHLHQSLLHQKHEFQEIVDLDGYLVEKSISLPSNCPEIKILRNHDLSLSTVVSLADKNINHDDYLDATPPSYEAQPHCHKFSELQTSQSSPVDVIKKILNNEVVVGRPEPTLIAPFYLQQREFGNSVHQALERNSTSWVIYHLATIYWRSIGDTEEAMECIKRLFQFSPKSYYDLPLLHLSNILHRGHYIHEALMPLKDAIYMSPESGVLFYTLGKIYISLGFLSQALRALQTSLSYKYRYDHTHLLMQSLQCEMNTLGTVHNNKNKIKLAYEKLEEFYRLLGDIYHHQVAGTPLVLDQWIQLLYSTSHQYNFQHSWIHKKHHRSKQGPESTSFSEDFQGILEAVLNELSILEEEDTFPSPEYFSDEDLETELENAFFSHNQEKTSNSKTPSKQEKSMRTSPSESTSGPSPTPTLVVKISDPMTPSSPAVIKSPSSSSSSSLSPSPSSSSSFLTDPAASSLSVSSLSELSDGESHCPNTFLDSSCPEPQTSPLELRNEQEIKYTQQQDSSDQPRDKKSKYTEAYRQMEFIPYNALPVAQEELIFPSSSSVLTVFNDPTWPNKKQCLELVEDASDHLPRFTGTFLTPEARGIKFKELLSNIPSSIEGTRLHEPNCVEIAPLPFSMAAFDHLEGVSDRSKLTKKNVSAEAGLKQLLLSTVEEATGETYTFEQAADKLYHAMKEHKFHWALFNLASIYWRALGDGYHSIECLRRGIDLAQLEDRDVGYIGLANVLHRHGYLESAIITARAALDIRPVSPVGHYTLAGIYLTCGDLVATNIHLRVVLNHQPNFRHALSALKLVRCSLKFKQEQKILEQKQQLLLAQQQLTKNGQEPTAENLQEALANVKLKQKRKKDDLFPSKFVGEDAVQYITKVAMAWRERKTEKNGSNNKDSHDKKKTTTKNEESTKSIERDETKRVEPSRTLIREQLYYSTSAANADSEQEPKYSMEFMAKDNEREEELRKKWPENLPWPTLEDCKRKPPAQYMVFTSTWLSVTAKKINITDYMDFNVSLNGTSLQPTCEINFELSEVTLNHFEGMSKPPILDYIAEKGLEEVLCKLSGSYYPMEEMASRMRLAMINNGSNWVISNLAALYWRIVGDGQESIKCLKHALYHAPPKHRDVAYVSLANVLYRSGYYENAASSMQLALETSPNLVVNHFTMANILAGQGYYREAAGYYELVLYHQPEFGPASDRLRCVRCMIILGENNIRLKQLHQEKEKEKQERLAKKGEQADEDEDGDIRTVSG